MPKEIVATPIPRNCGFPYVVKRLTHNVYYAQAHYPKCMSVLFEPSEDTKHILYEICGGSYGVRFVSPGKLEELKEQAKRLEHSEVGKW